MLAPGGSALHTGHRCGAFRQDDRYAVVTFDNWCQSMSRCVNHGQRLVIRQYWPPSSPAGIRGFLGCSRRSIRPSGGACTTAIRYRAGRIVDYQGLRHDHTARVQQGSRANGMRMDAGQAITIGQPGVHDYDVEAEARARR
jgi:hypothetical protein